ncbi:hypothetical protein [Bacillus solitudinis]|uniref:hypothetical protein n=1 Tax=Bacillus solitudinis TaxID=2014074 RepID=UPI000C247337|nr:hypothetical protein [Bacillus solitudinis]
MSKLTYEEQEVLRHYIIVSLSRKALEKDLLELEKMPLKFQEHYLVLIHSILNKMSKEMAISKKFMTNHSMNIFTKKNDGLFSEYHYRCQGYEGVKRMSNVHIKQQASNYIKRFFMPISRPN